MSEVEQLLVVARIPDDLRAALSRRHALVEYGRDSSLSRIRVAVTTSVHGFTAELMRQLPSLGLIACNGVGLDRIDVEEAARRGIRVCNTPGVLTEDVADLAVALMYAIARRVVEADRFVRSGRWATERMVLSRRVNGRVAGIVGLGSIGSAVARRTQALGLRTIYTGPRRKPDVDLEYFPTVEALAAEADFLILCASVGATSRGMVDDKVLKALGPEGYLINIGRGELVDEQALLAALESQAIAGAALDVFVNEPAIDPRFLALSNVVLQPHHAALTHETRAAMIGVIERGIAEFLAAAAPLPEVK
ncbi:MAG: 2-hydroxyacid dehydrogenase [Steroidobacteraceae bacterium]